MQVTIIPKRLVIMMGNRVIARLLPVPDAHLHIPRIGERIFIQQAYATVTMVTTDYSNGDIEISVD